MATHLTEHLVSIFGNKTGAPFVDNGLEDKKHDIQRYLSQTPVDCGPILSPLDIKEEPEFGDDLDEDTNCSAIDDSMANTSSDEEVVEKQLKNKTNSRDSVLKKSSNRMKTTKRVQNSKNSSENSGNH